jgi:trehalose 6-phosphate synthase/phosphatase
MGRLVIVSNRLPFTLRQNGADLESSPSMGGLVTALAAYLERQRREDPEFESLWVGWPGMSVPGELESRATEMLADQQAYPVFLSQGDSDDFYYGFCNKTLWPLFHYFSGYVDYDPRLWETYVRVNRAFSEVLARIVQPDDVIWVHDYHLLLLPELLRKAHPHATIGFFLHIPFPSHELFRLLPTEWKRELLVGMLGADVVGFHVHEYTQHFLTCVLRILGRDHHLGQVIVGDQIRRADTFPLGVDFEKFTSTAESETVRARSAEIAKNFGQTKMIISVDRLDYTKGIANRLRGYELFLERNVEWRGKVTFVLLVVPSRVDVPQYQQLKEELDERVGALNGRFATLEWAPIVYQFHAVDFEELVALYQAADVALITPLRDGMNLVAKEYLASKPDASGVLVLSELAGSAREMNEAMLINPHHGEEIAAALEQALSMPLAEQVRRNRLIRERLEKFDASSWAKLFLSALARVKAQQSRLATKQLKPDQQAEVERDHQRSRRALLLLDYDGTLVPIAARPELAAPDRELLQLLSRLSADEKNFVYLISGRGRSTLEGWFGQTPVGIIAEHGAWIREPRARESHDRSPAPQQGGEWRLTQPVSAEWKEQVASILRLYGAQVAGSILEEKDYSIAWHYRAADPELGGQRAKELIDELTQFTANLDLHVLEGKKVVEIRSAGVNKGRAAAELIQRIDPDFILAVGDDQTDEDIFRILPDFATSVHIGPPFSNARYCLSEQRDVRALLERIASNAAVARRKEAS